MGGIETRTAHLECILYYHDKSVCRGVYLVTAGHSGICRSHQQGQCGYERELISAQGAAELQKGNIRCFIDI